MTLSLFRNDFGRLFDDMESALDFPSAGGKGGGRQSTMALDLAENEKEYIVKADIPGVAKEDIVIDIKDNLLTLKAERKSATETKGDHYHFVERSYGAVSRSLRMPETADLTSCKAKLNDGVLQITIDKREPPVNTKRILIE
mmetsp:Transcript_13227/g.43112  ORF Transcript_13227/g.43112 Transcript_13227/m.43112 type:complete len:142 (+) Transcript_13227:222-647(+)